MALQKTLRSNLQDCSGGKEWKIIINKEPERKRDD